MRCITCHLQKPFLFSVKICTTYFSLPILCYKKFPENIHIVYETRRCFFKCTLTPAHVVPLTGARGLARPSYIPSPLYLAKSPKIFQKSCTIYHPNPLEPFPFIPYNTLQSQMIIHLQQGIFTMKKIALITDGWQRYVTGAWIIGYRQYLQEHQLDADLYVFHSFGNFSKDEKYNQGEYNIYNLPRLEDFDGIILDLATVTDRQIIDRIVTRVQASKVPAVSLLEKHPGLAYSGINDSEAMCHVTEHLILEHGCQKLNYIGGPQNNIENSWRLKGFKEALSRQQIPLDENRITHRNYEIEGGIQAFRFFLKQNLLPDAFICANDNLAVGICMEAKAHGYRVPEDFLVTGFDNLDKASYYEPRITTVEFSKEEVMYNGMKLLHKIWNGEPHENYIYAKTRYIFQESCHCISQCPPDRGQYVIDRITDEVSRMDMQNWIMNLKLQLIDAESYSEMALCLQRSLASHGCENMAVLMNPDIYMYEKVDDPIEIPDAAYETSGYPDQMKTVPGVKGNHIRPRVRLDCGQLFPNDLEENDSTPSSVYLFSPLHFRDREVGYLVFKNCDYLLDNHFLSETIHAFQNAVESLYARLTLKKMNKRLSQLYIRDSLTGLYNRMAYDQLAKPLYRKCLLEERCAGIMFVDADHLKYINDTFGHDMGNQAILLVATSLKNTCPPSAISMRYGGDEFVIIIPDYTRAQMRELEREIQNALSTLSQSSDLVFSVEASIGYVIADDPSQSLDYYINLADEEMYNIKKAKHVAR